MTALMEHGKKAAAEITHVPPAWFKPFITLVSAPDNLSEAKTLALGAMLTGAKRFGFYVDGRLGEGHVAASDVANEVNFRAFIHGFDHRFMSGYCR